MQKIQKCKQKIQNNSKNIKKIQQIVNSIWPKYIACHGQIL